MSSGPAQTSGDAFIWQGPTTGDWGTPANWQDITNPASSGAAAPRTLDTATINGPTGAFQTINGAGSAAGLALTGNIAVGGTLILGTLSVNATSTPATLDVTGGGHIQAGLLTLGGPGRVTIGIDSLSAIEAGNTGGAVPGALAVDAGTTLDVANIASIAAPIANAGAILVTGDLFATNLSGSGTTTLATQAQLTLGAILGGTITLASNDTLCIGGLSPTPTIAAGSVIALSGSNDVVTLAGPPGDATLGAITGFAATDVLILDAVATQGTETPAGLVLQNAGSILGTLDLAGDFSADRFLTIPITVAGRTATQIVLVPNSVAPASPGAGGHAYTWVGPIAGDWNIAANWQDLTAATNPAATAPSSLDTATIDAPANGALVLLGNAHAASVTLGGDVAIGGTLAVAAALNATGTVAVLPGATLLAATADIAGDLTTSGTAQLGALTLDVATAGGQSTLSATNTADIQATSLLLAGTGTTTLAIDANATVEIGATGNAQAGLLTVDAGATLDATNTDTIATGIANAGLIQVAAMLQSSTLSGNGALQLTPGATLDTSVLQGSEAITLAANAVLAVSSAILGNQAIMLAAAATLDSPASLAATTTIALAGDAAVLHFAATPGTTARAAITGFGGSDQILLPGTVTSATDDGAALLLQNGPTPIGTLDLHGNFAADRFLAIPLADGTGTQIVLAPGSLAPTSAGTSAHSYLWTGPLVGDWNIASNWQDLTTGSNPASTAPGSLDSATIDGPTGPAQLLLGAAQAATTMLNGDIALGGTLTTGTLDQPTGSLEIAAGGTLSATTAALNGSIGASGPAALAQFGTLSLTSGGQAAISLANTADLQAAQLTLGGAGELSVTIDPTATLEVGQAGAAAAGALTVDAGHTLSTAADVAINAGIANSGTIDITGHLFPDSLSGAGTVDIASHAELNAGTLLGNQAITVSANATLAAGSIPGSPTITMGNNATLTIGDGTLAAGSIVTLAGTGDVIAFNANPDNPYRGIIEGFGTTDSLLIAGTITAATPTGTDLVLQEGTATLGTLDLSGNFQGENFVPLSINDGTQTQITLQAACFAAGTRLRVNGRDVAVEDLRIGDEIVPHFAGRPQPIIWIGHRRVDCRRHPHPQDVWPIRISPHAFGRGQPARPLWLSPDHAVHVQEVLIPIRYLVNGATITQHPQDSITYWHVELPRHDVILAENLPCESYLDTGNRAAFANGGDVVQLHPDFAWQAWQQSACARLVLDGAELAASRSFLLARALTLGFATTDDPALHLAAGEHRIWPTQSPPKCHVLVPPGAGTLRLLSRSVVPVQLQPIGTEHRRLGVAVSRLVYGGRPIPLDDPRLGQGWHEVERLHNQRWRWTDGDAHIALPGGKQLDIWLTYRERYWLHDQPHALPPHPPRARAAS